MAKYTTELRTLIENSNVDLGMKDYPLYVFKNYHLDGFGKNLKGEAITSYRDYLNNKIYSHFYFREIGQETPHRFVFCLNRKMSEIMPLFNQLYESTDIEFNPLWNVDLTETYTHEVIDNGNTSSTETGTENIEGETIENSEQNGDNKVETTAIKTPNLSTESINAKMDTAQKQMSVDEIKAHSFLSSAEHNIVAESGEETDKTTTNEDLKTTNDNTINNTQTNTKNNSGAITNNNNRTENYTLKHEGSSAGYLFTQNIEQWRKIMINIDMQIIDELEELFIQIF